MKQGSIYLDHAAATPVHPDVLRAMMPFFTDDYANPSALYLEAQMARAKLDEARRVVAEQLSVRPQEIIFTAGGTESINIAIHGVLEAYSGSELLVSAIEHEAVLATAEQYPHGIVPVNNQGIVDLVALERAISDKTVLLSIMYANNEVGTVQPLRSIAAIVKKVRASRQQSGNSLPLLFHTDASQAGAYLSFEVSRLGVDLLTLNGGKMYGPKQAGCLYVRRGTMLQPYIHGGGQERGLRSGTENVAAAVGLASAFQRVQAEREVQAERQAHLRDQLLAALKALRPDIVTNGSLKNRLPNNLHVSIPGMDGETMLMQLDEAGIMVGTGSACSAQSDEPSHVLVAMGIDKTMANASLRFSLGESSTEQHIQNTVTALQKIIA
jgi:cysteine desulfurase